MATKENQLFLKKQPSVTDYSDSDISSQFFNLNLNQNQKCSKYDKSHVHSFSKSSNSKNFGYTVSDNYQENKKLWNKSTKDLHFKTSTNPNLNIEIEGNQKRWKNVEKKDQKNSRSSTLSLHIAAYENSFEADLNEFENLHKESETFKSDAFLSMLQDFVEFPRQMDGFEESAPEIMQFKTSQRLLAGGDSIMQPGPNDPYSISRLPRSSGSLGFKRLRRRPKRNADPVGFEQWAQSDREFWKFVTKCLRNWRATERQCSATRRPITFFQNIKLKVQSDRKLYQTELDAYRQTLREYSPIPNGQSFDLP